MLPIDIVVKHFVKHKDKFREILKNDFYNSCYLLVLGFTHVCQFYDVKLITNVIDYKNRCIIKKKLICAKSDFKIVYNKYC